MRRYSVKETYNFKEPTNRSHPISYSVWGTAHSKECTAAAAHEGSCHTCGVSLHTFGGVMSHIWRD